MVWSLTYDAMKALSASSGKSLAKLLLVYTFLQRYAFEPGYEFSQSFFVSADILVPWPALYEWISDRLAWVIDRLA